MAEEQDRIALEELQALVASCEGMATRVADMLSRAGGTDGLGQLIREDAVVAMEAAGYLVLVTEQLPMLLKAMLELYHEGRVYVIAHDEVRRVNREQVARLAQAHLRAAHLRTLLKMAGDPEVKMAALLQAIDNWWAPVETPENTSLTEQVAQQG